MYLGDVYSANNNTGSLNIMTIAAHAFKYPTPIYSLKGSFLHNTENKCTWQRHPGGWRTYNDERNVHILRTDSDLRAFSFFKRRGNKSEEPELSANDNNKGKITSVDLYKLFGLPKTASTSDIERKVKGIKDKLEILQNNGNTSSLLLLLSLLDEGSNILQNSKLRKAYDSNNSVTEKFVKVAEDLPKSNMLNNEDHDDSNRDDDIDNENDDNNINEYENDYQQSSDIPDVFQGLFGGSLLPNSRRHSSGMQKNNKHSIKGDDVIMDVNLAFKQAAVEGCAKNLQVRRLKKCSGCKGTGGAGGARPKQCHQCKGKGMEVKTQRSGIGIITTSTTCRSCSGHGIHPPPPCDVCGGESREPEDAEVQVEIPAGVEDGTMLKLKGEGSVGHGGGSRGNLIMKVHVDEHPKIKRQGSDLTSTIEISFLEAILGCTKHVETIDGLEEVIIPPNVSADNSIRIQGRGAFFRGQKTRGDHVVKLKLVQPTNLSDNERELLKKLSNKK